MLLYNLSSGMYFTGSIWIMGFCTVFFRHALALVSLALLLAVPVQAKLQVLASIKPLALIAQEIAGDKADVATLLPITASPHDYPLKMSDHKHLHAADLVLWIGPEMESFLARPLRSLAADKLITSYQLTGLYWPDEIASDHHHNSHSHRGKDPHLWLDPRNASLIAEELAARLAKLQPESAAEFHANAERFRASVQSVDQQIALQLAPVKEVGFAVYHEGYGHFVGRYGLHQVAYVTYSPERRPGAKHLQELREILAKEGVCLFTEPYYKAQGMEEMAASLKLRIGLLDPIGDQQVSSYQQLLEQLSQSFLTCLTNGRDG